MITFAEFLTESGATTAVSGHANEHFATSFINDYVSSMNNHMSNGASEDEAHERAMEEMNDRQYKHEDWKDHSGLEKAHKIFDKEEMSKMHDDSKETTQEIINFLKNKYDIPNENIRHLWHPSEQETYRKAETHYKFSIGDKTIYIPNSKKDISKLTGIPMKILDEVFSRGVGAYKNNPKSVRPNVKSPEQWAMARVYSFVMKGKTYNTADSDLADKVRKLKIKGYIR